MIKNLALIFCCCLPLAACTEKAKAPAASPVDFVAATLGEAAEQAHSELAMLAQLRGQGVKPLLPAPHPSLDKQVSVSWTGPASGVLKDICLQLGYRYRESGAPSTQALTVVVYGLRRPAYAIIEDIAWQIQPQGSVLVDPVSRVITLARTAKEKK
jgi:hypothetical protein